MPNLSVIEDSRVTLQLVASLVIVIYNRNMLIGTTTDTIKRVLSKFDPFFVVTIE